MQRRKRRYDLARIRVVGAGGGGVTALDQLLATDRSASAWRGVDFVAVDADQATLGQTAAAVKIQLGDSAAGLSGGADAGRQAAEATLTPLRHALNRADMVFVLAGLGGGTGSGAAPVIARLAKELGALVIGIVTYPFAFEGTLRAGNADTAVAALRNQTDTLIVLPNDRLLQQGEGAIGFHETYRLASQVWRQSVAGISDLVNRSGLINVDFADVRAIMSESGAAIITAGTASGPDRARRVADAVSQSELLGLTIDGARGILFNVVGGPDLSLTEVESLAAQLIERAHPGANVIFGAVIDPALKNTLQVTLIATGFQGMERSWPLPLPSRREPVTVEAVAGSATEPATLSS
ncbi:MAG: cell division protein FtsZ [Candidatus Promineifilaceae bacterium]|nr:cell division protein FtsZ [Candidatus Promineifilaceae bacterium]